MGRPSKKAAASRANGATSARKMTKKRVPVAAIEYGDGAGEIVSIDLLRKYGHKDVRLETTYRPPAPKGYFYADELFAMKQCMSKSKSVRFESPPSPPKDTCGRGTYDDKPRKEAENKAVKLLQRLRKDSDLKARTHKALAKAAGIGYTH